MEIDHATPMRSVSAGRSAQWSLRIPAVFGTCTAVFFAIFANGWEMPRESVADTLDNVDYRILQEVGDDGRISDVALGERINLSSTAVARRRRILEEKGIIRSYGAVLDLEALGFSGVVVVALELTSQAENVLVEFEREVVKCPSLTYCGFVSGETDFLIVIHVSSLGDYDKIYRKELSILPHVARIRSSFVLREVARRVNPPVVYDGRR
jgi:Lrp/AsnC family transcriptional regulator, leucine-responsive regulatory protein